MSLKINTDNKGKITNKILSNTYQNVYVNVEDILEATYLYEYRAIIRQSLKCRDTL